MIKLAIPGSAGRMGGMLIRAIAAAPDLELVAATDRPDSPLLGVMLVKWPRLGPME